MIFVARNPRAGLAVCFLLLFSSRAAALEWVGGLDSREQAETLLTRYSQNLAQHPNQASVHVQRGNIHFLMHDFDSAIWDFSKALDLDSTMDLAYFGRGMAHGRNGEIDAGINDLTVYIKRHPDSSLAFTKRGVRYLWKGDRMQARADLSKAVALNPRNAEAHDDLGVVYALDEKPAKAIQHFRTTIKIDPSYQKAYHNLAMAYFITGNGAVALPVVDQALAMRPNDRNALLLKAQVLDSLGRAGEAKMARDEAEFLPEGNWSERISIQ
ncbi:MAG TPA: tetratricopeptide repeat protein [Acidiferrobacteraceae bacterium]|nr:tetratricopeptide repeat protein [Acidiferrobacteraceae bacterium]